MFSSTDAAISKRDFSQKLEPETHPLASAEGGFDLWRN